MCSKSENGRLRANDVARAPNIEARLGRRASIPSPIRKDQFCFKHIRDLCGQAQITTGMLSAPSSAMDLEFLPDRAPFSGRDRICFLFTMSDCSRATAQPTSRPGYRIPLEAASRRLSSKIAAPPSLAALADRNDPQTDISSEAPSPDGANSRTYLVEPDGIEPTTSCLQSTRSPN